MNKEMRGSRIEKRLQREIENLYANEGLTRDLNDSSARILLELLEEQVRTIVNNTADLEDADAEEIEAAPVLDVGDLDRIVQEPTESAQAEIQE